MTWTTPLFFGAVVLCSASFATAIQQHIQCYSCANLNGTLHTPCDEQNYGDLSICDPHFNACVISKDDSKRQFFRACTMVVQGEYGCVKNGTRHMCTCQTNGCNQNFQTAGATGSEAAIVITLIMAVTSIIW